jgi:hypothetical protein
MGMDMQLGHGHAKSHGSALRKRSVDMDMNILQVRGHAACT